MVTNGKKKQKMFKHKVEANEVFQLPRKQLIGSLEGAGMVCDASCFGEGVGQM